MKKYLIATVVIFIILIFILQIKTKKTTTSIIEKKENKLEIGREISSNTSQRLTNNYYTDNNMPQLINLRCNKKFEDIISEYGKEWGPIPFSSNKISITPEETNEIFDLIIDYISCEAIKKNDISKCYITINDDLRNICKKRYHIYYFVKFLQNPKDNISSCNNFLREFENNLKLNDPSNHENKSLFKIIKKVPSLCEILTETNLENACNVLKEKGIDKKDCIFTYDFFCPSNKEKCKNILSSSKNEIRDIDCEFFSLMGEPELFDYCRNTCEEKLIKLTSTYCSYIDNAKIKTKELEEKKLKEEEKIKAEQEKLRKIKEEEERKKLEGEIIKKAKQAAEEAKKFKGRKNEEE